MPVPTLRFNRPLSTLRRSGSVIQVGLDVEASALLPDAPPGAEHAVRAFNHWRTPAEAAAVGGVDPAWMVAAAQRLAAVGVLGPRCPPAPDAGTVAVLGGGPLARRLAALLARAGVRDVVVDTPGTGLPSQVRCAGDAHEAVAGSPALVVVAALTIEPDRLLTDQLRRAGLSHLVVRVEPERAVVGPFVVPGLSPCVRCLDLGRCDLDPEWPLLLAQLARTRSDLDELATSWAVSTAATMAVGWLHRARVPPLGTTLELPWDALAPEARTWRAHPRCGCSQPS